MSITPRFIYIKTQIKKVTHSYDSYATIIRQGQCLPNTIRDKINDGFVVYGRGDVCVCGSRVYLKTN